MTATRNKLLRQKVYARDFGVCEICRRFDSKWQADHVLALHLGGKDDLDNLRTLCRRHHTEKSSWETTQRARADRLRLRADLTKKRRQIGESEGGKA